MTWIKVGGIVAPIILAVVVAAAKLSADATELRRDVSEVEKRVNDLRSVESRLEAVKIQLATIEERIIAQNANVQRFWLTTWPALEARLTRIETILSRGAAP